MMKQYIMFLLGLLILSACTNDEYLAQRTEVEEGIPTVVKLSVTIPMSGKIETKAFSDSGVADLYVFSFKKDNDEFITAQSIRNFPDLPYLSLLVRRTTDFCDRKCGL